MNENFLYCKIEYPSDITISLFEYSSVLYNIHLLFKNAIEFERKRNLKRSELDELKPRIKSIKTGSLETVIISLASSYLFLKLLRMNLTEFRQILSELRGSLDEFSKIIEKIGTIKQSAHKSKELKQLKQQLFDTKFLLNKRISTISYLRNLANSIAKISPSAKVKFSSSDNYNNIGKETFIIDDRTKHYIEHIEREIIYSDEITASILIEELDHRVKPFRAKIFILDQSLNLLIKSQQDFERLREHLGTQKPLKVKLRFIINIRDFTKINRAELINFI